MDKTYVHFDVSLSFERDLTIAELAELKAAMCTAMSELARDRRGRFDDIDASVNFERG